MLKGIQQSDPSELFGLYWIDIREPFLLSSDGSGRQSKLCMDVLCGFEAPNRFGSNTLAPYLRHSCT